MTRSFLGLTAAVLALVVTLSGSRAALAAPPVNTERFFVNPASLPFDALPGTSTTRYWGIARGAGWRIEVPDDCNGDLVLFAHGYAGEGDLLSPEQLSTTSGISANSAALNSRPQKLAIGPLRPRPRTAAR